MATQTVPRTPMEEIPIITTSLPPEIEAKLRAPLPPEAIGKHPRIENLSSINAAYVIERLNDAFGCGGWRDTAAVISTTTKEEVWGKGKQTEKTVTLHVATVHLTFYVEKYGIHKENFGGSDNVDLGDALKGARTDALTKIASELGVGLDVYKKKRGEDTPSEDKPACPNCGKKLLKSRDDDSYFCWTKRDGCGATFTPDGLKAAIAKKTDAQQKRAPASAPSQRHTATPVSSFPVADKITISAKITEIRMDRERQTLHVQVGQRDCVSKQLEIWNQFAGKKNQFAELMVSPIQTKEHGTVYQIHKVIAIRSEREAAGHDTI